MSYCSFTQPILQCCLFVIIIIHSFYIALFSALKQTHCTHWHVILNMWLYPFCYMAGATWNRCCLSTSFMYTIQPCISLQCQFIWSHICWMHVWLAVTCYLHFWQNNGDLSCATVVTAGWNRCQNKSAQEVDPEEENLPIAPAGTRTRDFSITSTSLYHRAIPAAWWNM